MKTATARRCALEASRYRRLDRPAQLVTDKRPGHRDHACAGALGLAPAGSSAALDKTRM